MAYRTMPLVDPIDLDPRLAVFARRFRRDGLVALAQQLLVVIGFCALVVAIEWLSHPRHREDLPYLALALVVGCVWALRKHVRTVVVVPNPPWRVRVDPEELHVDAYERTAHLPLAAINAATRLTLRDGKGAERVNAGVLMLHLVDGSRFPVPEGSLGFEEVRLAVAARVPVDQSFSQT